MTLLMLLEMVASAFGDRLAIGTAARGLTYQQLLDRAANGSGVLADRGAKAVAYVGTSDLAFPIAVFAAAWAGIPLLPLNYRLSDEQVGALLANHDDVVVITDDPERAYSLPMTTGQTQRTPPPPRPAESGPQSLANVPATGTPEST